VSLFHLHFDDRERLRWLLHALSSAPHAMPLQMTKAKSATCGLASCSISQLKDAPGPGS